MVALTDLTCRVRLHTSLGPPIRLTKRRAPPKYERAAGGGVRHFRLVRSRDRLPDVERKVDMGGRRQLTNRRQVQYRKANKSDMDKILYRVVSTTGLGYATARRILINPRRGGPLTRDVAAPRGGAALDFDRLPPMTQTSRSDR